MQTDFKRIKQDWSPNNQKRYTWIFNELKEGMQDFNYDIKDYILKINKPKLLNFIKKLDIRKAYKELGHKKTNLILNFLMVFR